MANRMAVIFDVDGVLVDSFTAHFRSWQILAAQHNREFTEEEFLVGFGRPSREVIIEQWPDRSLGIQQLHELADRKEAIFRELISSHFPAMDGATDVIKQFRGEKFDLAVGSSAPRENIELILQRLGIGELLSVQVTGDDVTAGKPDPQVFLLAAEGLHMPPGCCAVVEDSAAGIQAAKAAGMTVIGLVSTGHTHDELSHADVVVNSLRTISPLLVREMIMKAAATNS
ncbi:MAG: HAD family phosphatase [Planctomycetota bacterium]|nr:HAD family phosphatase [Planctomycetota bacterium]